MKKITLSICAFICFHFGFAQQDLIGDGNIWTLHYMVINGTTINVTQPHPSNPSYHPGIQFFESSPNYYDFYANAGDINVAFNASQSLSFGSGTFTVQFPGVTLGSCSTNCALESQYLGLIITGSSSPPRTFDYQIIDEGNGHKTLIIDTPEGNRAVHGNFVLSLEKFQKKSIVMYPNPVKKKLYFDFKGFSVEKIDVLSVVGSRIFETKISHQDNSLDLSFLSPGIYFIKTTYKDGDTNVSRFIKE
ncbi:T9SS type A sorting domain-containing protein [Kordia sp. YSTF-M3]|uniref:T9SS type A sorting domain-containing protein n=1 Tax=Kordia aestuariivivens TaxID=2759037 RepID=A0ABR7QBZ3_9FLAO|nr:T9SS type A sorting domain-containing protein [Kordia aestuariivivens]MBC8756085.1 T9SS type A sorting domain-containing protein [Kordia aestuariivivens]